MTLNGWLKKHVAQLLFFVFTYYIRNKRLVTFTSIKMGVSTVPCTLSTVQFKQKAPYLSRKSKLWLLLIDNILVYKLINHMSCGNSLLFSIYFSKCKKCLNCTPSIRKFWETVTHSHFVLQVELYHMENL